jgi:hypothetical protein
MADRYVGCIRPQISRQWDQQPKLLINGNQKGVLFKIPLRCLPSTPGKRLDYRVQSAEIQMHWAG